MLQGLTSLSSPQNCNNLWMTLQCMPIKWRIGLDAGKTSKLLFQRSTPISPLIGASHYTAGPSALSPPPSFLASLSTPRYPSPNISMLSPTLLRHRLLKLLSISTSTHVPSPSTTIRLFKHLHPYSIRVRLRGDLRSQSLKIRPMGGGYKCN